jgi:hypothetical protein
MLCFLASDAEDILAQIRASTGINWKYVQGLPRWPMRQGLTLGVAYLRSARDTSEDYRVIHLYDETATCLDSTILTSFALPKDQARWTTC